MDNLGHQMTHSIDSFITDSANSATALNTGHKSSVNALNVYADSSPDPMDDPKVETCTYPSSPSLLADASHPQWQRSSAA